MEVKLREQSARFMAHFALLCYCFCSSVCACVFDNIWSLQISRRCGNLVERRWIPFSAQLATHRSDPSHPPSYSLHSLHAFILLLFPFYYTNITKFIPGKHSTKISSWSLCVHDDFGLLSLVITTVKLEEEVVMSLIIIFHVFFFPTGKGRILLRGQGTPTHYWNAIAWVIFTVGGSTLFLVLTKHHGRRFWSRFYSSGVRSRKHDSPLTNTI